MAKVLVTGANGFVGKALCRLLTERGYDVYAAVRTADKLGEVSGEGVVVGEAEQANWQLDGVDSVVHLAARVHVMHDTASDPLTEFRRVNVAATERLARQAAASGVKRLVFLSSIKVNGEGTPKDRGYTESDPPAPVDPYGVSKLEAEQTLQQISRETGLEVVIVRPPLIYGAGVKGNFSTMLNWVYRGVPLPVGLADNRRSLIGLGNISDLLETCLRHPAAAGQTFLASEGDDVSTPELLRRIAHALNRQTRLLPVPEALLRLALRPLKRENMIDRLFGSLVVSNHHARERLGWSPPVSMQEGLAQTARWYLQER